jgi:hypothetical protein
MEKFFYEFIANKIKNLIYYLKQFIDLISNINKIAFNKNRSLAALSFYLFQKNFNTFNINLHVKENE